LNHQLSKFKLENLAWLWYGKKMFTSMINPHFSFQGKKFKNNSIKEGRLILQFKIFSLSVL